MERLMGRPLDGPGAELVVKSLGTDLRLFDGEIARVRLVGSDADLAWTRDGDALRVKLPAELPGRFAFAFRIERKD